MRTARRSTSLAAAAIMALTVGPLVAAGQSEPPARPGGAPAKTRLLARFTIEEVEPGVLRVLHDGFRDLSGAAMTALPETYGEYGQTHLTRSLTAGRDGSVWVFERDGFYELGTEPVFDWAHQPKLSAVDDVKITPDGTLWRVAPGRTLRSFDDGSWTRYWQEQHHWGLDTEPDGTVWATWVKFGSCGDPEGCVPKKLGRHDRRGWTVIDVPRLSPRSRREFAVTGDGEAWLCCKRNPWNGAPGLLRFDGQRWNVERSPFDGVADMALQLDASDDGTLWTRRSSQALERYRDGQWTVFTDDDGVPPLGYVGGAALLRASPDGSVWVTPSVDSDIEDAELKCDGVAHFNGTTWTRYLRDTCIFSMDVAPDGTLWLQGAKVDIYSEGHYKLGETVEPVQTFVITPNGSEE